MRCLLVFVVCAAASAARLETVRPFRSTVQFEPNPGRIPGRTQWIARGGGGTMYIAPNEAVIELMPRRPDGHTKNVHMRFVGGSSNALGVGLEPTGAYVNHYSGPNGRDWFTGIPLFGKVKYSGVYPGIDVVYYGNQRDLEYDFEVAPGADPSRIELAFSEPVTLERGDLVVAGARIRRPRVFQQNGEVAASYRMTDENRVRIALADYDSSQPLRIDPVIEFSTFLGGPGDDTLTRIVLDKNGFLYTAGLTETPSFPVLDPFQQPNVVVYTPIIFKFTADMRRLVYYTTVNCNAGTYVWTLAVDASGNVAVTGNTQASNLPLKNAVQTSGRAALMNGYVTKFSPDGKAIVHSTYFGGEMYEVPSASVFDAAGNLYTTGVTQSKEFPIKNAIQSRYAGGPADCVVAKFSPTGDLLFSTFLGGSGRDRCSGIALTIEGGVILAGSADRDDFPLKNPIQTEITPTIGYETAMLAKLAPDGALVFATFFGGPVDSLANAVQLDAAGNIYVTGIARNGFITKSALQVSAPPGATNAFVSKFDASLKTLIYSTLLGGSVRDYAQGLAVDDQGNVTILGQTRSPDFPLKQALQQFRGGSFYNQDLFVAKIGPSGNSLIYSTPIGGTNADWPGDIQLDSVGNAYIVGVTESTTDFPIRNAYQRNYGGGREDAFILKITDDTPTAASPLTPATGRLIFQYVKGSPNPAAQQVTVSGSVPFVATSSVSWLSALPSAPGSGTTTVRISVNAADLAPGIYNESIRLIPQFGTPASIDVTLTVLAQGPMLNEITPDLISIGSEATPITIRGSGFTRETTLYINGVVWRETPVTFVDSTTLRTTFPRIFLLGEFNHVIHAVNPQSAPSNSLAISVGKPAPQVSSGGVVSAASYAGGAVSPGEIVTIFGSNFGEEARVLFDDIPATLVYVTPTQISATVPYLISNPTVRLMIESQGLRSAPVVVPVLPAHPALFTSDSTGKGQAAALNEDGTVNGTENRAARGSIVVLYGTGGGKIDSQSPARLTLPVKVFVDGIEADVLYAGVAPGLVSGAVQINARIPEGTVEGNIVVQVGEAESQQRVRIAIR